MNIAVTPPRIADHTIDPLFIERWSPRAFAADTISQADLMEILEAARWAPSAINVQPWRFAWGLRGDAAFTAIEAALLPGNRAWAGQAAALVVVGSKLTRTTAEGVEVPNSFHAFDAGTAWGFLALGARMKGWATHAMGGFDHAKMAEALSLPEGYGLHAVVAVGRAGDAANLPEALRAREVPSLRRPLAATTGHGRFPA